MVISSISALCTHLQKLASDGASVRRAAGQCCGADGPRPGAGDADDRRQVVGEDRIIDVQFADFMRDPFATIGSIYERMGRELTRAPKA